VSPLSEHRNGYGLFRQKVSWTRWDAEALRNRTSHPIVWYVTEPDGYERSFGTKAEAIRWIDDQLEELAA
jgi:hypothetical protein